MHLVAADPNHHQQQQQSPIQEMVDGEVGIDPRILAANSNPIYDYEAGGANYGDYESVFDANGTVLGIDQPVPWPGANKEHPWWVPLLIIVALLVIILIVVAVAIYCGLRGTFSEQIVVTPRRRFDLNDEDPSDQTSGRLVIRSESRQTCGSSRGVSMAHEAQEVTEMQTLLSVPVPAPTPVHSHSTFDLRGGSPATPTTPTSPRLLEVVNSPPPPAAITSGGNGTTSRRSTGERSPPKPPIVPDDPGHNPPTAASTSRFSSLKPQLRSTDTQTEEENNEEFSCKL